MIRPVEHIAKVAGALVLLLLLAVILSGCSSRELFHPSPTGKPSCGVFTVHGRDGTVTRHGRPCR